MTDGTPTAEHVANWLGKEGYRLEYQAHNAFVKAKGADSTIHTGMGLYIQNPEKVAREIDVFAAMVCNHGRSATGWNRLAEVAVICECKYSKNIPWVLLCSEQEVGGELFSLPHSDNLVDYVHTTRADESSMHFAKKRPLAHGLVQAFRKDNRDLAYEALKKISDAAWDHAKAVAPPHTFRFVIPALIVEGPLFSARFDANNSKFVAEPIQYGRLLWRGSHSFTGVDVVNVDSLDDYAVAAVSSMRGVHQRLSPFVQSKQL